MAVWKDLGSWKQEYFGLDEGVPPALGFEKFFDLWKSKQAGRFAPAWQDYQFEELSDWWGSIMVIDFQPDPFNFQYRLFGTKVVKLFGIDVTGKWASELFGGKYDISYDMDFYEMLSTNPSMSYSHGSVLWQNREHVKCAFLELPLSDNNETVTNLLSLMTMETK